MDEIQKATELFSLKYHCSQAVFASFATELGLTEEQALKIGACFGSGMCKGEVCGAVTGALMALGLKYGQSVRSDMESRYKTNRLTVQMMDQFANEQGSCICRDLLGCDLATEEGIQEAREKELFTKICPKFVETATRITKQLMEENEMNIKVLGGGCAKCNQLENEIKNALIELGLDTSIEHVNDFEKIAAYGVMRTPALVINEQIVSSGSVLKKKDIVELIRKFK